MAARVPAGCCTRRLAREPQPDGDKPDHDGAEVVRLAFAEARALAHVSEAK